ncbi:cyd operon protein YbgE [Acerihabitans arboris]|uniref:Cyd operon protein YbgE n=1 Tax=Acerihabitans arboris TaxID=2691583 RepID=A0A845SIH4_9GAMM|nr:cyd operon protein YbgE [Acerihabitans arboris]NDL62764.1 cyd operon protein YbgE [Acerihabitans arboris]
MRLATDTLYRLTDSSPLRLLSLIMALVLAGCVFWMPARFASTTSSLTAWHNLLIVWAVCAGVIHGVGFRPRRWGWRLAFLPLAAMVVLAVALGYSFL